MKVGQTNPLTNLGTFTILNKQTEFGALRTHVRGYDSANSIVLKGTEMDIGRALDHHASFRDTERSWSPKYEMVFHEWEGVKWSDKVVLAVSNRSRAMRQIRVLSENQT